MIEVLVILFWFNPFIYWYRKSIREVHEYLADQAVEENGHDQVDYQKFLSLRVVLKIRSDHSITVVITMPAPEQFFYEINVDSLANTSSIT